MQARILSLLLMGFVFVFFACSSDEKQSDPVPPGLDNVAVKPWDNRGIDPQELVTQMNNSAESAAKFHTEQLRREVQQFFREVTEGLKEEAKKRWPVDNRR